MHQILINQLSGRKPYILCSEAFDIPYGSMKEEITKDTYMQFIKAVLNNVSSIFSKLELELGI